LFPKEIAGVVASKVLLPGNFWRPNGQGYSVVGKDITKGLKKTQGFRKYILFCAATGSNIL
jgi:hypothetical protein